jgi:hypothetical protein
MANHCYNYGYFVGSRKQIQRLLAQAQKLEETKEMRYRDSSPTTAEVGLYAGNYSKLLMNRPDQQEDGNFKTGFDVYEKYGSKWFDAYLELQEYHNEDEIGLTISGDSAWSPALPLFVKLCKKYKLTCEGNYDEPGMDFAGEFTIDTEGNLEETQLSYREFQQKNNPECFWDDITNQIDDGYFQDIESVYAEFNPEYWKLIPEEKEELKKCFDTWQSEQSK